MEWIKNYDILFLREVRVLDLYEIRKGSLERGKLWDEIVERFNSFLYFKFIVNKRLLRDKFNFFMVKFKDKNREEERVSGISLEL